MKQVFDTMSEATGVDFTEIMRAGTYDAKVNRKIELTTPAGANSTGRIEVTASNDAAKRSAGWRDEG